MINIQFETHVDKKVNNNHCFKMSNVLAKSCFKSLQNKRECIYVYLCACVYLVMFECAVDQQRRLLLHPLNDSMGHTIIRLGAGLSGRNTVLIIHILLGRPGCVCKVQKKRAYLKPLSPPTDLCSLELILMISFKA